jgi:hypothetical protein
VASRITAPAAWPLAVELLRSPARSVAELSRRAGHAYSWTYAVVLKLEQAGIARRRQGSVEIVDEGRLFDLAAFERPILRLTGAPVIVRRAPLRATVRRIEEAARRSGDRVVFTGLAGASLALGRFEAASPVCVYSRTGAPLKEELEEPFVTEGTAVLLLAADRDVESQAHQAAGVRVASMPQLLLDLAGEGMAAREAALEVVARLRRP